MAGTRRGAERRDASDAFEAANPFLARVETKLEVELVDDEEWGGDVPMIKVTEDGEEVDFSGRTDPVLPGLFATRSIFAPTVFVEADEFGPIIFRRPEISVSEYGFGVLGGDEPFGDPRIRLLDAEEDGPEDTSAFALNDDEVLQFDVNQFRSRDFGDEDIDRGGVSFEIEYMVLGGSGQVGIALFDYGDSGPRRRDLEEEDGPDVTEALSGLLSAGDTGTLTAGAAAGGLFEEGTIFVEGGLEVVIVGMTLVTNFEGGPIVG